ncbi:MAG: diguanylate cyclase [Planctomycetes bacterium]|nr:diguanylate cyclase [Planctomycetota bacterium]
MNGKCILLAEDHPSHAALMTESLTEGRDHIRVINVRNKGEFIIAVRDHRFDCAVLDFYLNDCQGDELLAILRNINPHCPAIIVSSSDEQEVVVRALRSGSTDFIRKDETIINENLRRKVDEAIKSSRQLEADRRRAERRQERLTRESEQDPLTGLKNRRFLTKRLEKNGRAEFNRRAPGSILMIDIDHFKGINDRYGHVVGDEVLCRIAGVITDTAGSDLCVSRWGGEEFVVLAPNLDAAAAHLLGERIRLNAEAARQASETVNSGSPNQIEKNSGIPATVSVGVSTYDQPYSKSFHFEHHVERADRAMYLAKKISRNRVASWDMVLSEKALKQSGAESNTDTISRYEHFVDCIRPILGPTQLNHMTTHGRQVADAANQIGVWLGLEQSTMARIRLAAQMHDAGKYAVPERTLAAPGPLSIEEKRILSLHATDGARVAAMLGADTATCDFIRHHHTPCDASSKAKQEGERGGLGAGILAAADALVTMTTHRNYQPIRSIHEAFLEMQRHVGTQFDPRVVEAFAMGLKKIGTNAFASSPYSLPISRRAPIEHHENRTFRGRARGNALSVPLTRITNGPSTSNADRRSFQRFRADEWMHWRDPANHREGRGRIIERSANGLVMLIDRFAKLDKGEAIESINDGGENMTERQNHEWVVKRIDRNNPSSNRVVLVAPSR